MIGTILFFASSVAQVATFDCSMVTSSVGGQPVGGQPYLIYANGKWIPDRYDELITLPRWAVDGEASIRISDVGRLRVESRAPLQTVLENADGITLSFGYPGHGGEMRFSSWTSKLANWRTESLTHHAGTVISDGTCKILKLKRPSRSFIRKMQ